MRDLLNRLDGILMEKARGLLYRDAGDAFFQGSKDNPTAEIVFDSVKYFPSIPGSYANYNEMAAAQAEIEQEYPNITWSNRPTSASKAFAILTFNGPGAGQKTYFGRYFNDIKQDMAGLWKNSELPGGWQLNKAVSLKGAYFKLKPVDLFPPDSKFDTPADCVAELSANAKQNPAVPKIVPGMQQLLSGEFPRFDNVGDMVTAIRDDLGETIGPIALVQGMKMGSGAEAARRDILGDDGSFAGSVIYFPASKNNGLVDSYLRHPGGIEIGISSKGEKGASASAKNISDGIKVARERDMGELLAKYAEQVEILDEIGSMSSVEFPIEFGVRQQLISTDTGNEIRNMIKTNDDTQNPEIIDLMSTIKAKTDNPRYNRGYHALAALARKVAVNINKDPKFGEACLDFLNTSPIIQLHLSGTEKGGNYQVTGFTSKYPPDFKGNVGLDATKVYASTGIIGRISFSYNGGGDTDTDVDLADPLTTDQLDAVTDRPRFVGPGAKAAGRAAAPKTDIKTLGRRRRSDL